MPRTGRPPKSEPTVAWRVYLPITLAESVELILLDPMRERVKYGSRGALVEQLLREWLEKQRQGAPNG